MQKQEEKFQKKNTTFKAKPQKKLLRRIKRNYKKRIHFKARSRILKLTKVALSPLTRRRFGRAIVLEKLFVITFRILTNKTFLVLIQNNTEVTKPTGSCGKYKTKASKIKLRVITKSLWKIFSEKISFLINRKDFVYMALTYIKKVRKIMIKNLPPLNNTRICWSLKKTQYFLEFRISADRSKIFSKNFLLLKSITR